MTPVRVLHVLGCMVLGGAELRLVELIERLTPGEFEVDVCALSGRSGALDHRIVARGGRVIPVPLDRRFALRFIRLLRTGKYRVVHSHVLLASGPILALARAAGVPVRVAHFHSMRDGRPSTLVRRAQRCVSGALLDRCATDIIACGEGAMDAVWHAGWREDPRCRVVYDAVDPSRFEEPVSRDDVRAEIGVRGNGPVFIHIGYDDVEKNHPRLLRIFAAILARVPGAWLVLAGDGTDRPEGVIARQVRELGIEDRVLALGPRLDVPRLLRAADALLLPSFREGLPGVVLEAAVAGVPVLATDLPGVREIAARLPGISYLSLTESDEAWAGRATALPEEARGLGLVERAPDAFRPSVFHVDRAVEAHRALWRRNVGVQA